MNLPNKITMLRIVLIPFFVFFMLTEFVPYSKYIAAAVFIIASLTDTLDGYLARKYQLVSNFGKFMDPLADKLLVCSALVCFVAGTLSSAVSVWWRRIPVSSSLQAGGGRLKP